VSTPVPPPSAPAAASSAAAPSGPVPPTPPLGVPVLLPDIPEAWLDKIKNATKPGLVATVLGSGVLAALIGLASGALAAHYTNQGNERLEAYKEQLQARKEQSQRRRAAYTELSKDLDSLATSLDAYLRIIQITSRTPADKQASATLQSQKSSVGLAQRGLLIAKKDPALSDSQLTAQIDDCLTDLNGVLSRNLKPSEASDALKPVLDQVQDLLARSNAELSKD
jgi:DNA-binding helix-hairpin-helix protein with protein kinase domain